MSSGTKTLLGILTFLPVLGIILFVVFYILFIVELANSNQYYGQSPFDDGFPATVLGFIVSIVITGLVSLGMTIFYCIHASRNKALSSDMRLAWILINVFGGVIGHIIYFFSYITKDRPVHPSNM